MKKSTFTLCCIISFVGLSNAQTDAQTKDCKTKVETDDFTKQAKVYSRDIDIMERVKWTAARGSTTWYLNLTFEKEDEVRLAVRHERNTDVYKGALSFIASFDIKFSDGTVFRFDAPIEGVAEDANIFKNTRANFSTFFTLTDEQLAAFAEKTIEKCRVVFTDHAPDPSFEKEVRESRAVQLQKEARCFTETLAQLMSNEEALTLP